MKFLCLISWLTLWVTEALASRGAGPYQMAVMWYAYRMDVQTKGAGQTSIAPGCIGTVSDKSCTFNEFLQHISSGKQGTTTSISDTDLDPDVQEIVNAMDSSGNRYIVNQQNLLPKSFDKPLGNPWNKVWESLGDVVAECRTAQGDAAFGTKLTNVQYAMAMTHYARLAEDAEALIKNLNSFLQQSGFGFSVTTKTVTAPDGVTTYEAMDSEATLEKSANQGDAVLDAISKAIDDYNDQDKVFVHYQNIMSAQAESSRVRAPAC